MIGAFSSFDSPVMLPRRVDPQHAAGDVFNMKRALIGTTLTSLFFMGAFWAASPSVAVATQDVGVGNKDSKFRLLRVAIPADGKLGDILRRNAQLTSGFKVIDRRSMGPLARATTFDSAAWGDLGADVVILASKSGSQIKIKMYELSKGNKPVLSRGYVGNDPLKAANTFMNEVVGIYDKEPGVFGSRIAYVRKRRNPTVSMNIQTVQMNGEATQAVTNNRSLNILPSMTPTGSVLFTSYAKRNPDLWMSSGGAPKRISKYPGLNLGGVMSPDGSTIALALSKDGNSEIYTLSPEWTNQGPSHQELRH